MPADESSSNVANLTFGDISKGDAIGRPSPQNDLTILALAARPGNELVKPIDKTPTFRVLDTNTELTQN